MSNELIQKKKITAYSTLTTEPDDADVIVVFVSGLAHQMTYATFKSVVLAAANISGLGTMATQNANSVAITGGSVVGITDLAIADGGTGASTASGARSNLGLGSIATINDAPSDGSTYGRNNGGWQVVSGGSSLPVTDTTSIVEGSVDDTKELRIEVDGLTTSTTRVWTAQDADLTVAGINVAQSFSALQSFTGADHAGIRLNNLTTTDRDLLTPSAGMLIYNTTDGQFQGYTSSWGQIGGGGGGSSTLADIATNSTSTAHQTFALDASTQMIIEDSSGTDILIVDEASGDVGIGTSSMSSQLHIINNDSVSNAVVDMITIGKNTSGSPGSGMGAAIHFELESTTTENKDAGGISIEWTNPNEAFHRTKAELYLYSQSTRLVPITYAATNSVTATVDIDATTTVTRNLEVSGTGSSSKFTVKDSGGGEVFGVSSFGEVRINVDLEIPAELTVNGSNNNRKLLVEDSLGNDRFYVSTFGDVGLDDMDISHKSFNSSSSTIHNGHVYSMTGSSISNGFGGAFHFQLKSSTSEDQSAGRLAWQWDTATHASRASSGFLSAYYTSTERKPIQWAANSSESLVGFYDTTPIAQPDITGSRGGNAALADLLTKMANLGLITDSTTA